MENKLIRKINNLQNKDNQRQLTVKQPVFNLPSIIIILLIIIWLPQIIISLFPNENFKQLLAIYFGFIPTRFITPNEIPLGYLALVWTIFTHALLHSGWEHLFINSVWLVIFGTPVAYRYGARAVLIIFFISAAAGALFFAFLTLPQISMLVGASGGVAGLTGVAIRFIFQPIKTAKDPETEEIIILGRSLASFRELMANKTTLVFIIIWVGLNALIPLLPILFNMAEMNIAWQAHLGGFFAGLFLAPLFEKRS